MKSKRIKINDFLALLLIQLVLTLPFYTANVYGETAAGTGTTTPSLEVSIPRFFNMRSIDITGIVTPASSVYLFVNDMNAPKKILSDTEVGSSGKFTFTQVQLAQENTIKISAIDKSGAKVDKTFELSLDTQEPAIQLNDVPQLISAQDVKISGTANEPVTIKAFISIINNLKIPSKITGLTASEVGQNSIKLSWDQTKDDGFSNYVVYRSDVGAIAAPKPADYNIFTDALVDSGKSYTYQVSAVNIFGKEGPKSEPLDVKTLDGGQILNHNPSPVDIFEEVNKPQAASSETQNFNLPIKLDKGDGDYSLRLVFEDRAGNKVSIEKSVKLDTRAPIVKLTNPPSGAFIFENLANSISVEGKTEPNARVHLFIDRTPLGRFDGSVDISGLPNEIQKIPEAELDAKCRTVLTSLCKNAADFSATADAEGNFKFEKVDLTSAFSAAARISQVSPTDFKDAVLNQEAKESKSVKLFVVATDQAGLKGFTSQSATIGTCWSGSQSWDIVPLTQSQSPALLSTERMAEGTETLYFYFDYSYIGRGTNAKITGVSLSKACGSGELLDPRFSISCQIMPSGGNIIKLNSPDNTVSYSSIPLGRTQNMDKFSDKDWKSFLKAINNELSFPFKVRITYEHDVIDGNGQNKRVKETQTTCNEVSYVVDNTLIDPRNVLPGWMLNDFVDYLQNSISALSKVQGQIERVLNYVAIGCLLSFVGHLVTKIYRIWVEFSDDKLLLVNLVSTSPECKEIIGNIKKGHNGLKLSYFSDADLKKCFPSSYSAWQNEAKMYELQRWSCDRVFGHSSPSKWTEKEKDEELYRRLTSQKTCGSDLDTIGKAIIAEDCRNIIASSFPQLNKDAYNLGDKCFSIEDGNKRALFKLGRQVDGNLYEIEKVTGPVEISVNYAIKRTERSFMTAQTQTCSDICGVDKKQSSQIVKIDGEEYIVQEGKFKEPVSKKEVDQLRIGACVTVNECREWYAKSTPNKEGIQIPGKGILKDYSIQRKGYTSDCFYNGDDISVVSETDPNTRKECCCIIGKSAGKTASPYYEPNDVDTALSNNVLVHESKSASGTPPRDYDDMKWSYRYSKIPGGYLGKKYNPNRYIEGRDLPACFGQNNLFYQALGKEKEVLSLNPFKQDTAALQCVYLTGINQRLQLFKNIMAAMSTCLVEVRTNGRADAGVCKELFTQHVCGLIWQGIRFLVDGCNSEDLSLDAEAREEGVGNAIRKGLSSVHKGITEAQNEISEEYGNAKLNTLLGIGQGGISRKLCLAAFGYDWDINARTLVDAAYASPFATLVQPVTRSREFITVDPQSHRPKYEYRASWLINPGCDLENYNVQLACVSQKEIDEYPNAIDCGAVGSGSLGYAVDVGTSTANSQCDCLNLPQEQIYPFFSEGRLKQNALVERDFHKLVESDRRYDHLKFTLRTDRKIPQNIKSNCFPTGYEKGVFYRPIIDKGTKDIADCTVQPASGLISCAGGVAFFSRKGTLQLIEVMINDENAEKVKELRIGEPLNIKAKVTKTGKNKCLKVSMSPDGLVSYQSIDVEGVSEVPITITNSLKVEGRKGSITTPDDKINYESLEQNNNDAVTIKVEFVSDDPTFSLNDPSDKVLVEGLSDTLVSTDEFRRILESKTDTNGEFVVSKSGAKLKINEVLLNSPTNPGEKYRLAGVITINPKQQTSQTSQQKIITLEILNLKGDKDSFDSAKDCDLNDKVLERTYRVTVKG